MNKTALKKFATEARIELLERVELQARKFGITADNIQQATVESSDSIYIEGNALSSNEVKQRNKLISRIQEIGFDRLMEEVSYTWFNRFTALRFMEVNDYLPTKVRVLSSTHADSTEPQMIKDALTLDLDLDKEYVYELKMNSKTDELFKYLIIKHCNDLNKYMPFMFETIDDYTEILFPDELLSPDSFLRQMTDVEVIPERNWEKVEIIGWLYQYYISDENERVIQAKKRYKSEEIPFATQLFTPEWIVRYMVQNALGRYWLESYPEHRDLIENWEYYLENPNPEADFEEKLAPYINKELNVEDIKCFDPAMGSGHILVYMFDVLHEIYSKAGYMEREIPRLIIENNLYGLDIDDRAYQLASFSVVMKALEHNKRFLRSIKRDGLTMNLASIQETNTFTEEEVAFLAGESSGENFETMKAFSNQFQHAKAIGSLIKIESHDKILLQKRLQAIEQQSNDLFTLEMKDRILSLFRKLIKQVSIMDQQYDVFVTNPPYAGRKYLTPEIIKYLDENYSDVKSDLFSAFIEYSFHVTKKNGQMGFMSPFVWMFISSYEKLRQNIIGNRGISSLIQLEYSGFDGATVPICTFTLRNYHSKTTGEYIRLSDFRGSENQPIKTLEAVKNPTVSYRYSFDQANLNKIPGSTIAYWLLNKDVFTGEKIGDHFVSGGRHKTHNNNKYVRYNWEVQRPDHRWVSYDNGGEFRKYYGNDIYLVDWSNEAVEFYDSKGGLSNSKFNNKVGISWNKITSAIPGFKKKVETSEYSSASPTIFNKDFTLDYNILGFLNSKVSHYLLKIINPTLNTYPSDVLALPYRKEIGSKNIRGLVKANLEASKLDWNSNEISNEFIKHALLRHKSKCLKVSSTFKDWKCRKEEEFQQFKQRESELNLHLIEIYELQDELTPEVEDKDITIRKADLERDIKSFISYAIGCSFGRYSLDEDGLIYAGGEFDPTRYETFHADEDNILPILPGAYFEDDIVTRFVGFVRVTYGEESLSENLDFVADAIGRRKNETARETLRRYFMNDFYKDHVQTYKKRPIYWLFTSGKEKAFNCLIYMHRYDKSTLSRIRTDYLHEYQVRLDVERSDLASIIESDNTTKEINDAKREMKLLDRKIDELKKYDEVLHHMADMQIEIDLDDGVKVNYEKFKGLVAKI